MARSPKKEQLYKAQKNKNDEFYTQYRDICDEVLKYADQLRGKRILCPCDWDESYNEEIVYKEENHIIETAMFRSNGSIKRIDIEKSKEKFEKDLNLVKCNFVKYLVAKADDFGIKSISACGYDPTTDNGIRFQAVDYSQYDLIITNPPFSQFREFIDTMFKNNMEFLVIGPLTAISYKEIFPYIKENKLWLGYNSKLSGFIQPDGSIMKMGNVLWYTNLDVSYRHNDMLLQENYTSEKYPYYKEYGGLKPIYISKTKDIPFDYDGCMAVPISFLEKYNPEQFDIIAMWAGNEPYLESGKRTFARMIIKNKNVGEEIDWSKLGESKQ